MQVLRHQHAGTCWQKGQTGVDCAVDEPGSRTFREVTSCRKSATPLREGSWKPCWLKKAMQDSLGPWYTTCALQAKPSVHPPPMMLRSCTLQKAGSIVHMLAPDTSKAVPQMHCDLGDRHQELLNTGCALGGAISAP